ncbi:hypothetical protein FACS1894202_14250 [Clostridia bacterium]|nr:hypothetical protein FACS1894202_14250 [Clostridia bacterium]
MIKFLFEHSAYLWLFAVASFGLGFIGKAILKRKIAKAVPKVSEEYSIFRKDPPEDEP